MCISFIWWAEDSNVYVTSVDTILLLRDERDRLRAAVFGLPRRVNALRAFLEAAATRKLSRSASVPSNSRSRQGPRRPT
jgi:hypothetical protein